MATEVDFANAVKGKLDGKAPTGHNHDDRYYTEAEADGRFVRTVNGTGPDGGGNVAVNAGSAVSDLDDVPDSATRLALTPAERTKLGNTSGTNTGDQTLPTWSTLPGMPVVVAAGATSVAVRKLLRTGLPRVSPDDFDGATDHAKLQAAVTYALNVSNGFPAIELDRIYNVTGGGPITIDKTSPQHRRVLYLLGTGGGITKTDAGILFTSTTADTGDVTALNVKYESTVGAGTVIWDGAKLIRIHSSECDYRNVDKLINCPDRWLQSVRFHKEHVVGGSGPFALFRESYDTSFDDCLIEHRADGIWNMPWEGAANRNLRITKCVIEGLTGMALKLAASWSTTVSDNYFEYNGLESDPYVDLHTLMLGTSAHRALTVSGNLFIQTPEQLRTYNPGVLFGAIKGEARVESNVGQGVLFKMGSTDGALAGAGNVTDTRSIVNGADTYTYPGLVMYPGQEHRFQSTITVPTTTATRPQNPPIGEPHFDATLGKQVVPRYIGRLANASISVSAPATSSGTLTLTIAGVTYTVPVVAGDTTTQIRDKLLNPTPGHLGWLPNWVATTSGATVIVLKATRPGVVAAPTFNAGGTGVTMYFGVDAVGTNTSYTEDTPVTTTSARPSWVIAGEPAFDTTLGKPIWCKAGAREVDEIHITAAATAAGLVTVTLNGVATNVAVASGDSVTTVATKIRAASFTGWAVSGTDVVAIFRAIDNGVRSAPAFSGGSTGVTAWAGRTVTGVATVWVDATGATV